MANNKNLYNSKDSLEISELASLNEDISEDLIEQLQQKVIQEAGGFSPNENDDSTLFEEPNFAKNSENINEQESAVPEQPKISDFKLDTNYDDNFIKKYKAKLNKQTSAEAENKTANADNEQESTDDKSQQNDQNQENASIEKITNGNITERIITKEQKQYNDSLDFLDGNIKYSKYVIYIDPQNVDFIEGLTVKERKNLINGILKQQNDVTVAKRKAKVVQSIIMHVIISILTIAISVPIIYTTINASLEASINNYRRSQSNFQVLYKEKGKITNSRK